MSEKDDENDEVARIVVVGQNRARLSKIMELVNERKETLSESEFDTKTKLVPCLAALQAYPNEDGNQVRYMSNFVYHDGSSMTQFLDDEAFRTNVRLVLMVGYEWQHGDEVHIFKYFETNGIDIQVECIRPNADHDTLQKEMDVFKGLNPEDKKKHSQEQTMGPSKMAKYVIDALRRPMEEEKEDEEDDKAEAEEETAEEIQEKKRIYIDAKLPRYACKVCRSILFGHNHLHPLTKANYGTKITSHSMFCIEEVLNWLAGDDQYAAEGKLSCPNCHAKIGYWKWSGALTANGSWVTPAIQFPTSKVDRIEPVSISPLHGVIRPVLSQQDGEATSEIETTVGNALPTNPSIE
ncbi:unnamed protein product [Cylindrotheca closterium]|uniref:protein-tyrosine-phosphatase n=1 Tax=Cylindrotheca closterium TaxID=2856 RepID=A0AAD2CBT8_9STRA|nr:unnamed protein product [Cylindrotheca closterium]